MYRMLHSFLPLNDHNVQLLFSVSLGFIFCLLCILPTLLLPLLLLLLLIPALHSLCIPPMMGSSAVQLFCIFSDVFLSVPSVHTHFVVV